MIVIMALRFLRSSFGGTKFDVDISFSCISSTKILKETIRNFFVAKNVLWKKATYITNIGHTPEMKGFLNEAIFGLNKQ